jgi:uncharacterized protein (TIGR03086 family)
MSRLFVVAPVRPGATLPETSKGTQMEPIEQLARILPTVSDLVDRIRPTQLDDPTPCTEFTVRDVLDHMLVLGGTFAYWFRGEEAPEVGAPAPDGQVPAAEFRRTMDDLLDAVTSPGAMARTVLSPFGEMPGETFARLVAFDGLVHGWDLASSTGQQYQPSADVVAAVDQFARAAITDEMRDGDTFKAATAAPEDADRLERLVAFSGRSL